MTTADRKLVDEAIQNQDFFDWWNEVKDEPGVFCTNGEWVINELLEILEGSNLDLKVIRKK